MTEVESTETESDAESNEPHRLPLSEEEIRLLPVPSAIDLRSLPDAEPAILLAAYSEETPVEYEVRRLPELGNADSAQDNVAFALGQRTSSKTAWRGSSPSRLSEQIEPTLFPLPPVDVCGSFPAMAACEFADVSPDDAGHSLPIALGERNAGHAWAYPRWHYLYEMGGRVGEDYANFYSGANLAILAAGLGVGATLANTSADDNLRDFLHENLVYTPSDEYAEFAREHKFLGNGLYLLPVYTAAAVLGNAWGDESKMPVIGEWGERTVRGILVGAPPLLALQLATGGSRPGEVPSGSNWHPLQDDNGVSGHAFMGAVPLISAAKMTDQPLLKATFYAFSTLPGLSRISDDVHYPSQVFLGWGLAYLAASAVDQTQRGSTSIAVYPWTDGQASGAAMEMRW